jgi:anti-anti-sigma factor
VTGVDVKTETAGDVVRIVLDGDIDMDNADDMAAGIYAAITNQITATTIDLSHVGYIDSAGLRVLFELAVRLPIVQIDLEVVAPPGSLPRRVLDISGFPEVASVVP